MKLLKKENIKLKEENRRLRLENNRRLKVEEHEVNSAAAAAATMVNPSNEVELFKLQNQLSKKEMELKQLLSEKDTLMMKLTEKQQQIKALQECKMKSSSMEEDEIALLQDENIALMERIEGGELFNVLDGLTTTTGTEESSVESQKNASFYQRKG